MPDITRREWLHRTGCAATALAAGAAWRGAAAESGSAPNFVIVLADDLGYGDLGCYGGPWPTPHLDRLAAEGLRFTDYHANGPVCSPTRAALMTGRYQQRCGVDAVFNAKKHRDTGMGLEEITIAEVLRGRGYAAGLFGKWHLGYSAEFNPIKQGFDDFRGFVSGNVDYVSHVDQEGFADWWQNDQLVPEEGYTTELIAASARRFMEERRDRPFLAVLTHGAPHYPYQGPGAPAIRIVGDGKAGNHGPEDASVYGAMLSALDQGVGAVRETLERLKLTENTFFLFVSDNGATGPGLNGPLRDKKGTLWEGGHRVPAIAWWPGRIAAGVCAETVVGMDVFPTLTALAGAALPERGVDGVDMGNVLFRGQPMPERDIFWWYGKMRAMRRGPWKLVIPAGAATEEASLFDLVHDLGETKNLAGEEPERVESMLSALKAWEAEVSRGVVMKT